MRGISGLVERAGLLLRKDSALSSKQVNMGVMNVCYNTCNNEFYTFYFLQNGTLT